jgi:hypothetical protein
MKPRPRAMTYQRLAVFRLPPRIPPPPAMRPPHHLDLTTAGSGSNCTDGSKSIANALLFYVPPKRRVSCSEGIRSSTATKRGR